MATSLYDDLGTLDVTGISGTDLDPTPEGSDAPRADADVTAQSPFQGMGALLEEMDEKKVCESIIQMVRDQAPARRRRRAEWAMVQAWVEGIRGVRVRRMSEDRNDIELVIPLGARDLPPLMDRVDELLDKTVSHLLADPPVADAEPANDTDQARDAAEFTTRLLTIEGSESGFNNLALVRRALRKAGVFGSGFVYPRIDPTGGGWRPMEIRALPTAQSVEEATIDPVTREPLAEDDERLTTRYVRDDQTLTDNRALAARQWLPKLSPEVLTGEQVVLIPETCSGANDALGAIIIRFTPLGQLKGEFKELNALDDSKLKELVDWRPEDSKRSMKGFLSGKDTGARMSSDGKVSDTALVCTLSLYFTSHFAYPKGAYICVANPDVMPVLHRQVWAGAVELGDTPSELALEAQQPGVPLDPEAVPVEGATGDVSSDEEMLMLPLAQFRQLDDDLNDDPMGRGLAWKIGPADEVRGEIVASWLDYLDNFLHPNILLPLGSNIDAADWNRRDGTPLYFNPAGIPQQEQTSAFPPDAKEFFDRATDAQNSATGLEEAAVGADSPNAVSGVAKQIVVQQAHVNLATMRANTADGQERLWRIIAQQYRVFYTIPTLLKYVGEDGAYKAREWSRADLGSTRDIKIKRGSFTQQSPEQKQQNLDLRLQAGQLDPEEYARLSNSNLSARLGFQDNPHRMRVRRQLSAWRDGPPADFDQKQAEYQQQVTAYQTTVAPIQQQYALVQQAAAVAQQPAPPPPEISPPPTDPMDPFGDVRLVDDEQDVARIRWLELRRENASTGFTKKPPAWQQYLVAAYQRARQAAGVATLAEQQQAQAQAAATQQQNALAQQAQKGAQAKEQQQSAQVADASKTEAQQAFASDQATAQMAHERELQAMEAQGAPPIGRA